MPLSKLLSNVLKKKFNLKQEEVKIELKGSKSPVDCSRPAGEFQGHHVIIKVACFVVIKETTMKIFTHQIGALGCFATNPLIKS